MHFNRLLGGTLAVCFTVCSLAYCQITDFGLEESKAGIRKLPAERRIEARPLEGAIDPGKYILGPGDLLEMAIWGDIELSYQLRVSPDGSVSAPGIGEVQVAGISIADAEKLIIERSRRIYSGSQVSLTLLEIRTMMVSISGAVDQPGMYEMTAVDRLSMLIFSAGGFYKSTEEKLVELGRRPQRTSPHVIGEEKIGELKEIGTPKSGPSKRRLRIVRKSGEAVLVDFQRYEMTGDLEFNPILRDGDQVHVPLINRGIGVIHIFGAVKAPGEYEFFDGDRLVDLVELAGGFDDDALLSEIEIVRFADDNIRSEGFNVDLTAVSGQDRGPLLRADDRVFVRRKVDFRPKHYVTVIGEVMYPGVYPIEEDVTTLTDVIEACRGFLGRADIAGGYVRRWCAADSEDPEYERLRGIQVADMSEIEYGYFKLRSREVIPLVGVDFDGLFNRNDLSKDIVLKDKDLIEIPVLDRNIAVTGKVRSPGIVKYRPDENYMYYIREAGGFSWNARKSRLRLIKAHSGVWVKLTNNTKIEKGDTIFVPEKTESELWVNIKDVLLVVSQIATIIVVIQTLR